MAALTITDRTRIWRGLMRYWSDTHTPIGVLKSDLYNPTANTGAIADSDAWIDTHGGNTAPDTIGYNGALAVAVRNGLTTTQKTEMFCAVAAYRASPTLAAKLFNQD
jgi:hypothetical protein